MKLADLVRAKEVRLAMVLVKLVGVPVAVVWVVSRLLADNTLSGVHVNAGAMLVFVLLTEISFWLVSLRLAQLLEIFNQKFDSWQAFRINLQSVFYFLVVPTTVGTEFVRFTRLRRLASHAAPVEIMMALLLDRAIGVVAAGALFAVAATRVASVASLSVNPTAVGAITLAAATLGVVLTLSGRLRRAVADIARAVGRSWQRVLVVAAIGVAVHALTIAAVHIGALGLGANLSVVATAWGLMGGVVLMLVPVSFAGLGFAEIGGAMLLLGIGVDQHSALLVVLLAYLGRVLAGLQGAVLEMIDGGATLRRLLFVSEHAA